MRAASLFLVAVMAFGPRGSTGCSRWKDRSESQEAESAEARMRLVVQEAIRQAAKPSDKAAFQSGRVFVNLKGLDMQIVGVAVPMVSTGKRALVSFTMDHFQETSVDTLAKEALEDFGRASQASESPRTAPQTPEWCKSLPRPEFKALQRVLPDDPWFKVYKVAPGVFAIYEPHQAEEVISYLIVGNKQALLFDTGMGIADIRKVTAKLTSRPVVVLNSHTHDDHVGGNWQFTFVYGMDTDFTRTNAKGSREDAQAEITPDQLCGDLPKAFNPKTFATKPWKVSHAIHDGFKVNLGGRTLEVLSTPGHTPDAICLLDRENGLLFTGDTYYPAPIWLFRPETDLDAYVASVKRLAALAPELKLVLGAHNIPVAQPDVLPKLVEAIQAVRSGQGAVKPAGEGKVINTFGGFTFLLAAARKE